jgi:hypothetical protein
MLMNLNSSQLLSNKHSVVAQHIRVGEHTQIFVADNLDYLIRHSVHAKAFMEKCKQ